MHSTGAHRHGGRLFISISGFFYYDLRSLLPAGKDN